ncbi:hypothetical protein SEVIR_5G163000v4 [Setaria viridis]|uniref:Uncharacterized protein n=1 Tax=Setaria viridis TaxID=4556 RepID=A0A4U6UI24_SETVI|nr:hypothetical protein SEVIR_5G163000v2 [Setaria viridis]TKW14355.1 hypothetical protein SEVIR_5G163000v2 [Setaria viridis]
MGHHHTHASRGGVGGLGLAAAVPALLDRATNRPPMTSRIPTSCGSVSLPLFLSFLSLSLPSPLIGVSESLISAGVSTLEFRVWHLASCFVSVLLKIPTLVYPQQIVVLEEPLLKKRSYCKEEARREVRDHLPLCRKHGGR